MKLLAFICNVALFGFTCLVILTDGMSREAVYIVLTLLLLLVPVLNLVVIMRNRSIMKGPVFQGKKKTSEEKNSMLSPFSISPALKIAVVICNVVLLGFCVWAFMEQYPHPKEHGYIAYLLVVGLTPVLSSVAILFRRIKRE